jgi:hypothetical protein
MEQRRCPITPKADEVIEKKPCALMALSGHLFLHRECPLSGVKRT